MATSAQIKATTKYIKTHTKRFTIQCSNVKDADIIEFLSTKDNYTQYIKDLIRQDIAKKDAEF